MSDDKHVATAYALLPKCDRCMIGGEPANYRCDACDDKIDAIAAALRKAEADGRVEGLREIGGDKLRIVAQRAHRKGRICGRTVGDDSRYVREDIDDVLASVGAK